MSTFFACRRLDSLAPHNSPSTTKSDLKAKLEVSSKIKSMGGPPKTRVEGARDRTVDRMLVLCIVDPSSTLDPVHETLSQEPKVSTEYNQV